MALEKDLETKCRKLVEKRGGELLKFISPGNKGIQDRILLLPRGFVAFIEFKQSGGRFQPLQERWQRRMMELGHRAWVISDYKTFAGLLPE